MLCPKCSSEALKVVDKRDSDANSIRRRRECLDCGNRFTTYERIQLVELMVVKNNQRREPFSSHKVREGIEMACAKRPVSAKQIDGIVAAIEKELKETYPREVSSRAIGELVLTKLRTLDPVAFIRFASVYRSFTDLETFQTEVQRFLENK